VRASVRPCAPIPVLLCGGSVAGCPRKGHRGPGSSCNGGVTTHRKLTLWTVDGCLAGLWAFVYVNSRDQMRGVLHIDTVQGAECQGFRPQTERIFATDIGLKRVHKLPAGCFGLDRAVNALGFASCTSVQYHQCSIIWVCLEQAKQWHTSERRWAGVAPTVEMTAR
jgi:hypothetical protein